jgi:branched-chain amino acid transport system substrate-binding protein
MKILWCVLFALSVACAADNARAQAQSFVLGAACALTGDAATSGQAEMQAVNLAIEELNSRGKVSLELKVEDTASTGLGTVNAIKKLVEVDGVRILVGPTWLDSFQGRLPTTQQRGVLVVTPSASIAVIKDTPSKHPLVFSTYFHFHRQISVQIENAYRQGIKRVAVLFDQDPYFVEMRRIIGAETASPCDARGARS